MYHLWPFGERLQRQIPQMLGVSHGHMHEEVIRTRRMENLDHLIQP